MTNAFTWEVGYRLLLSAPYLTNAQMAGRLAAGQSMQVVVWLADPSFARTGIKEGSGSDSDDPDHIEHHDTDTKVAAGFLSLLDEQGRVHDQAIVHGCDGLMIGMMSPHLSIVHHAGWSAATGNDAAAMASRRLDTDTATAGEVRNAGAMAYELTLPSTRVHQASTSQLQVRSLALDNTHSSTTQLLTLAHTASQPVPFSSSSDATCGVVW